MGIAENIKENLKLKIQKNLDRNYIRRILKIIGKRPVLAAYGATFASKSDKYLNIASIRSVSRAYNPKNTVAYGSLFLPYEMFHALELAPFLPEVMGGFTGGMGIADRTLKEASSRWYTPDLCTFHRSASGAVELDIFPVPNFLICSNLACDAAQKTFYMDAKKFGLEDNYYLIDTPYDNDESSIKYLASQLEAVCTDICIKSGKKLDLGKFAKSIRMSNEFRQWALKASDVRKELYIYPKFFDGLNFILPFHGLAGTRDAVEVYKNMYFELSRFLKIQKKGSFKNTGSRKSAGSSRSSIINSNNNDERSNDYLNSSNINSGNIDSGKIKRILWLHLKPYYNNNLFNLLENNNYKVVFEEISNVYWPELAPEKPFESLAIKMLSHPLNGSVQNRVNAILKMVKDFNVDGVIMFAHWGCRHSNGGARIIKDSLKEQDIPMLLLDGDCLNKNNSSEGQMLTRLQGFMEIIDAKYH
jgi:benzoyl-CoA reductase/2-hydroxyglutaryl-CoA dehydratase subunit BcrC/BadD/HgdB